MVRWCMLRIVRPHCTQSPSPITPTPCILQGYYDATNVIKTVLGSNSDHFAAFKESITLNLAQRSFKVIHFAILVTVKSPCTTLYRSLIVNFALFQPFRRYCRFCTPRAYFSTFPLLFLLKFGVFCLEYIRDSGSAERGKVWLISRENIFQEFQPYDHDTLNPAQSNQIQSTIP